MKYINFGRTGLKVSRLGFGAMRLPMVEIGGESFVDIESSVKVIRYAFEKGVNYIDTGFLYCNKESEIAVGRALKGYRDKVILTSKATKMRMYGKGDLRRMLEHQLQKLDVEYLDFYLFHGIGWDNFNEIDKKTGWLEEMLNAKREKLVRNIGFSFHDEPHNMNGIIDLGCFDMVTCQYNYLDCRNEKGMAYARQKGLGVVVMGPVGGGRLVEPSKLICKKAPVDESVRTSLRFVASNSDVDVVLSGMSSEDMVSQNIKILEEPPLSNQEHAELKKLSLKMQKLAELYCTGCGYCMDCKQGVDIPGRFLAMNYYRVYGLKRYALDTYLKIREKEKKMPGEGICIECGECEKRCPQNIEIVKQLKETEKLLGGKSF